MAEPFALRPDASTWALAKRQLGALVKINWIGVLSGRARWVPILFAGMLAWAAYRDWTAVGASAFALGATDTLHYCLSTMCLFFWWHAAGAVDQDQRARVLPMLRARAVPGWLYLAAHLLLHILMFAGIAVFCAIVLQGRGVLTAPHRILEVAALAAVTMAHFAAWAGLVIALGAFLPRALVVAITTGLVTSTGLSAQALAAIHPWLPHVQFFAWAVQPVPALELTAMSGASWRVVSVAAENILYAMVAVGAGGWLLEHADLSRRRARL